MDTCTALDQNIDVRFTKQSPKIHLYDPINHIDKQKRSLNHSSSISNDDFRMQQTPSSIEPWQSLKQNNQSTLQVHSTITSRKKIARNSGLQVIQQTPFYPKTRVRHEFNDPISGQKQSYNLNKQYVPPLVYKGQINSFSFNQKDWPAMRFTGYQGFSPSRISDHYGNSNGGNPGYGRFENKFRGL